MSVSVTVAVHDDGVPAATVAGAQETVVVGKSEQIATVLEHEILSGVLGFGDRLQSENELVQRFSVSRNTVRKGLEELSSRGLITTKVGIGSFVTFDGKPVDDAIGWSRALADVGANAETRTLRLEVIEDADLAASAPCSRHNQRSRSRRRRP